MDQIAVSLGKPDSAILIDTATEKIREIKIKNKKEEFIIINTNKERKLNESKYNERRSECEKALKIINERFSDKYKGLCAISPEEFGEVSKVLDGNLLKRTRHAVFENDRVKKGALCLTEGDFHEFGRLMTKSHMSLKDDFEVSCDELDLIVDEALRNNALGARMTGAGFGGCAIVLVEKENKDQLKKNITKKYREEYNISPDFLHLGTCG